jgi:hypothetical protein
MKEYNVEVYAKGIVYSSVCTNMPKRKLVEYMGEHEPTGIDSSWEIAEENFRGGEPNGCDCPDKKGNKHWLVVC